MKYDRRFRGILIAAGVIACVIFVNSLLNSETSNGISRTIAETIQQILDPEGRIDADKFHVFIRKAAHFTEFAVLGILFGTGAENLRLRTGRCLLLPALAAALAVAALDEFIQNFTGRSSMVKDVLIDFGGAFTGVMLTVLWFRRYRKHENIKKDEHSF